MSKGMAILGPALCISISRNLIGEQGGDEDPMPPYADFNPHPMSMGFDDIWAGGHGHGGVHGHGVQVVHVQ